MGKRKQECPRKFAETGSDVSKLESIVKKLKTGSLLANSTPSPRPLPEEPMERSWTTRSSPSVSAVLQNEEDNLIEVEPLDLRLPRNQTAANNRQKQTVKQAAQLVKSNQPTVALNLSRTPAPSIEKCPTSTATTFQELSAKLEQYFSTGIAASKFPRKMVRGQDMWMQDIEQKRRILKCLKCGCSYNTLGELARHIKKSGHHNEAPLLATEASSAEPIRASAPRFGRQTMEKVASGNRNFLENPRTHQQEKISRGPSAFRPVQRSLVEPAAMMEASKKIEFRGNFSQSATRSTDKEDGFLKNVDLDRSFLQEKFRKNSQIGQSGFFHGVSVLPAGAPLRSDFSFGEKGSSSARNGLGRTVGQVGPTVGRLPATRPARAASSPKSPGISKMENESPKVHLPIKQELKMGSDQEQKEDARMLVTPSNFMMESSPLFALKKFLDFGIPRLKPTGIDGGRL